MQSGICCERCSPQRYTAVCSYTSSAGKEKAKSAKRRGENLIASSWIVAEMKAENFTKKFSTKKKLQKPWQLLAEINTDIWRLTSKERLDFAGSTLTASLMEIRTPTKLSLKPHCWWWLKNNGIPAELFKTGGHNLERKHAQLVESKHSLPNPQERRSYNLR